MANNNNNKPKPKPKPSALEMRRRRAAQARRRALIAASIQARQQGMQRQLANQMIVLIPGLLNEARGRRRSGKKRNVLGRTGGGIKKYKK